MYGALEAFSVHHLLFTTGYQVSCASGLRVLLFCVLFFQRNDLVLVQFIRIQIETASFGSDWNVVILYDLADGQDRHVVDRCCFLVGDVIHFLGVLLLLIMIGRSAWFHASRQASRIS